MGTEDMVLIDVGSLCMDSSDVGPSDVGSTDPWSVRRGSGDLCPC